MDVLNHRLEDIKIRPQITPDVLLEPPLGRAHKREILLLRNHEHYILLDNIS